MVTFRLIALAFLILSSFAIVGVQAADITLAKSCVDRYNLQPSPSSCAYAGLPFTVDTGTVGDQSNCTLASGNGTYFLVPTGGVQQTFLLPPSAPLGQNRIRCNITKTSFIEKPFTVYGAILDAVVDTPSLVYMNSDVILKVIGVNYDQPDYDAPQGFSACWNIRDPSSGQVIAQWACSNDTTTYPVPASLQIGASQFILLLQAHNYESLFKYVPVTVRNSPAFSSSIYPESAIVPTSGGRLDYVLSVAASPSAAVDLTASWSDVRVALDGKPSSVSLHVDAGKTGKFGLAFNVPQVTGCTSDDCPKQSFQVSLTDQYGNSQQLTGSAVVTDRYTSSFSISPESLGRIVVQPGLEEQAEVVLTNTGKISDVYSAVLIGDAASYSSITPENISLAAGGSGRYTIRVSGSSSLQSGPLQACFSSRNQPSAQACANASVNLGAQELPVSLSVQPRTMSLSVGENGTIEVATVSSIGDAVVAGTLESTCADWLSNTEWVAPSRTISVRYANSIYVKPTEVGTCTVKITLRAQGTPSRSATVEIYSSLSQAEIDSLTGLSEDILSNASVLQSKAAVLKNAGVGAAFADDLEQKATFLAEKCKDDVSNAEYSAARASCALARSGLKGAMDVLDYGGQSIHVSKPFYISPIAIASAIAMVLALAYLIVIAPTQSL